MLKKRIAALTMGAALATSAFLAPQAAAGTHDHKCEKGYELVAGTHEVGDKVNVDIPRGFKARDLESQSPAGSLKVERDGDFKIAKGEPGKNVVTLTFEKGKGKNKKSETATVKYTLDKCTKKKDDDKKDNKPKKSSVDKKSFTLSSKK